MIRNHPGHFHSGEYIETVGFSRCRKGWRWNWFERRCSSRGLRLTSFNGCWVTNIGDHILSYTYIILLYPICIQYIGVSIIHTSTMKWPLDIVKFCDGATLSQLRHSKDDDDPDPLAIQSILWRKACDAFPYPPNPSPSEFAQGEQIVSAQPWTAMKYIYI